MAPSLLAVHLSPGVLADPWWVGGYVGMAVLLALAMWRVSEAEVPRIGVVTAAVFVSSQLHIPLAVASVHLILNGLVGVMLGRRAPLAIAVGMFLQALLLHHGGLDTLGANVCIVSVPALAAGWLFPLFRRGGVPAFASGVLLGALAAGGAVALNFVALLYGGKEDWETLAQLVLLAHVPVAIVEGLTLGVVVRYLEKVKPELLHGAEVGGGRQPGSV